jgi:hypothetical protein
MAAGRVRVAFEFSEPFAVGGTPAHRSGVAASCFIRRRPRLEAFVFPRGDRPTLPPLTRAGGGGRATARSVRCWLLMAALPTWPRGIGAPVPANPGLFTLRFPGWGDLQGWSAAAAYSTILCADVDGDGQAELLGVLGGWLQTYHFDKTLGQWNRLADFQLSGYEIVGIEAFDLDGDGQAELVISTSGWKYIVSTLHFKRAAMAWAHDESWPAPFAGPVSVACGRLAGVGQVFVQTSQGIHMLAYPLTLGPWAAGPPVPAGWDAPPYASTLRCADLDGDGNSEVLLRGPDGIHVFSWEGAAKTWTPPPSQPANGPALSDAAGWNQPAYYSTVRLADVDGDGTPELVANGPGGIHVFAYSRGDWSPADATTRNGPAFTSAAWQNTLYAATITCADVDGDGRAEILARGSAGVYVFDYDPATATWTPDSDAGAPTGPAWSDAAGWNQPQYSLTIRAADVDGDGRAELMGRLPDGVQTLAHRPGSSSWSDASAPFPALQDGAYTAISKALGVANGQLRSMYGDVIADLTTYQSQLGDPNFLTEHNLDPSWGPSVGQLHAEVTAVIALRALFGQYDGYLLDVTLNDKINLDSVATAIELSQQVKQGSESITADILALLSGIAWSFSALVPDAPAFAVIAGLADSALSFAMSLPSGQGVPVNPVTETYEKLNTQLSTTFNNLRQASAANQARVLGDYGLLMTIGTLIDSGQWSWPVDPTPDPETLTEARYTLWAWQTLGAVAWTVCDATYVDGRPVPGDRSAPSHYDPRWFWWGPKTPTPNKPPPSTTQHCRWLLLAKSQSYAPVNTSVLAQLFGAPPNGLGATVADVLTGANGWAIPPAPP